MTWIRPHILDCRSLTAQWLFVVLFCTALSQLFVSSVAAAENTAYVPGQVIIQVEAGHSEDELRQDFSHMGLVPVRELSRRMNIWLFEYSSSATKSASEDEQVLEEIRDHPAVSKGQFNHIVSQRATTPDDPSFGLQWPYNNTGQLGGTAGADIDAPEAWDIVTGGTSAGGDDIVVAIIDGGFDLNHIDIDYWKNSDEIPGNSIDDDGNGYVDDYHGWNAYSNNGSIPVDNHGTHVAGTAGAIGNNATGVSGVNWGVKVMPIAGSSSQEATVIAAYGYVLELRSTYNETDGAMGAFVVSTNASFGVDFGNPANFPLWCAIYDSLGNAGILSAGATANLNIDIDVQGDVPTACPSDFMIAVTNTTNNDVKNGGAAYGLTTIDLGAPGTSVYSTLPNDGYGYSTGTSMATPHVCGAIALLYAAGCPKMIDDYRLDPAGVALQIRDFLLDGVDALSALQGITVTGGRLNLYNSVLLVQNYVCDLGIVHTPLPNTTDTTNNYEVVCTISSDTTLTADSLLLHYSTGGAFTLAGLTPTGGSNEYRAFIPAQGPGTTVDYFLTARDDGGAVDTTEVFSFEIIDYDFSVVPAAIGDSVAAFDTVWYDFVITNTGLVSDDYDLAVIGNNWSSVIFDSARIAPITQTATQLPDSTETISLRVIVPNSVYGDADTAEVEIISVADPSKKFSAQVVTFSNGSPLSLPFFDSFASTIIDPAKWSYVNGATVSTVGIGEPSFPNSLQINGNPSGADTLESQVIDLSSETQVELSYFYQRAGGGDSPEAGDSLVFEFYNDAGSWEIISDQDGAGADMTVYVEEAVLIPANGLHDQFKLRVRNRATAGAFDDWFIDDIRIALPSDYAVDAKPEIQSHYGSINGNSEFGVDITNRGVLDDIYDLNQIGGAWTATFSEVGGGIGISSTSLVVAGDTTSIIVSVAIPPGATIGSVDTTIVEVVSQSDLNAVDTVIAEITATAIAGLFPWQEPFAGATLDAVMWLSNVGASVSNQASNPPSPTFALRLDGSQDTVTTQIIDLSPVAKANLTFYYQRGGSFDPPETGDDLTVEYRNQSGIWTAIAVVDGGGAVMSDFDRIDVALPADALHGSFQLRLHSQGSGSGTDDWFIDDILLDFPPEISLSESSLSAVVIANDTAHRELIVANTGQGALSYSVSIQPHTDARSFINNALGILQSLATQGLLEPARHKYPEGYHESYTSGKGVEDTRNGVSITRDAGGPDASGYFWIDSDQSGGPSFAWHDISGTGTAIVGDLGDDAYTGPFALSFSFPFYDSSYTDIYVGSNGLIGFDSTNLDEYSKVQIPSASTPSAFLAWMWDDLNPTDPTNTNAAVYIQSFPDSFIVQFNDYPEYGGSTGDVITAQVIVRSDGSIRYQYLTVAPGFDAGRAAIGIENADGSDGLEIAFNTNYVHDGLAIEIFRPTVWLTASPQLGTIAAGEADTLDVLLIGIGLDSGTYTSDLLIQSNDLDSGDNPSVVAVSMEYYTQAPYICGDVDNSGAPPDVGDLTYLVKYSFNQGPAPPIEAAADLDGLPGLTIADVTYLVGYMFKGGPAPICL